MSDTTSGLYHWYYQQLSLAKYARMHVKCQSFGGVSWRTSQSKFQRATWAEKVTALQIMKWQQESHYQNKKIPTAPPKITLGLEMGGFLN